MIWKIQTDKLFTVRLIIDLAAQDIELRSLDIFLCGDAFTYNVICTTSSNCCLKDLKGNMSRGRDHDSKILWSCILSAWSIFAIRVWYGNYIVHMGQFYISFYRPSVAKSPTVCLLLIMLNCSYFEVELMPFSGLGPWRAPWWLLPTKFQEYMI